MCFQIPLDINLLEKLIEMLGFRFSAVCFLFIYILYVMASLCMLLTMCCDNAVRKMYL